jgi:hypothetical protein
VRLRGYFLAGGPRGAVGSRHASAAPASLNKLLAFPVRQLLQQSDDLLILMQHLLVLTE